jgi:DNA-binding CsgD family transcriptional regulator
MSAKRQRLPATAAPSRGIEQIYHRSLTLLAACELPAKTLSVMLRAWARWCGAQMVVLVALAADGAVADMYAVGPLAPAVTRDIAGSRVLLAGPAVRSMTSEGYSVLTGRLTAAAGVCGALAIGVRHPRRVDATQRRRLSQLLPVASVALQLTARREHHTPPRRTDRPRRLSQRERGVVALLLAGKSVKETAATLGLSSRTVETYVERLRQRYRQPRLHALLAHLVKVGVA